MNDAIRIGKVSSIDYARGMVQVVYHDKDDDVTRLLPLLSFEYRMPPVGALVLVAHLTNGSEAGVVLSRPWSDKNKPPEGFEGLFREDYDLEAGKCYFRYDANGPESLYHTEGDDYIEVAGNQETTVDKDRKDTTGGNLETAVTGDSKIEVVGNAETSVGGNRKAAVTGDDEETVSGGKTGTVQGDAEITVNGKLTLKVGSCTVTIDGGTVTVEGSTKLGMTAPTIEMSGTALNISGTIVNISGSTGDCSIMGKSLVNHTHTSAAPGTPTTPPI